jgi:dienelactone hydrolase
MDAFGLRPRLKEMADRLAGAGYTVLVPNLLYRHGPAPVLELPDVIDAAHRPALFEQLLPIILELNPDLAMRDADAHLSWLAACPQAADGPVGITGYCMGAGLPLRTAGNYPERVAAAAGFHGGRLATDAPDSPHLLAGRVTAELYFGHADQETPRCLPSRSSASTRRSPRRVSATTARSTPARTTATPWPTPPRTTRRPPNATGQPCSTSSTAPSELVAPPITGTAVSGRGPLVVALGSPSGVDSEAGAERVCGIRCRGQ